jgi:hypothetical protein
MDFTGRETHEWCEWECHLRELGLECRIALGACGEHAAFRIFLKLGCVNLRSGPLVKCLVRLG